MGSLFHRVAGFAPAKLTFVPTDKLFDDVPKTPRSRGPASSPIITAPPPGSTIVYTDGACSGNPGPGGWAWAVKDGPSDSGGELHTTNNRMELLAVVEALGALPHPVHVIPDSTYVKNGIQKWRLSWVQNGWKTKDKKDVKNRDLWEQLIEAVDAGEVTFGWVKGHSGDPMNDLVDAMAVVQRDRFKALARGQDPDAVGTAPMAGSGSGGGSALAEFSGPVDERAQRRKRDGRIPEGHLAVVLGAGAKELGGYDEDNPVADRARRQLVTILQAKQQMNPDLVVLTGMRLGAEMVAAEAAVEAGVPFIAVLPFPGMEKVWSAPLRRHFDELSGKARSVVTLEKKVPADKGAAGQALRRRDGWLTRAADEAVLVLGEDGDGSLAKLRRSLDDHFGDDLWVVEPA
jgi:ribonuclease HI